MPDFHLLLSVFGVIFVAEIPDKTAVAALVLATKYRPLPVFLGTALALTVQSLIAVAAGGLLSLLPTRPVHIGAGLLFLVFAVMMWRRKDEEAGATAGGAPAKEPTFLRAFTQVFGVVFLAEWCDLTQLGTATLAARYGKPLTVFIGSTLALWCVAAIAVFIGHRAGKVLNPALTKKFAAVIFVALGVALLVGWM
jgi:putative Ca2+/H+ antiporter (TMEM165/GDT1 family)